MATTGVTLASGNRVKHSKVRESAFGVIPTTPAMKNLRVTSSTLQPNIDTVESNELRTDRQIPDQTTVAVKAAGDINFEFSYNAIDDLIEEALQGAWSTKYFIQNTAAGSPISALSTTTATVASGGATFFAGSIVQASGFASANNNTTAVVVSSTSTNVVFPASTFTADASPQAGATLRVVGYQSTAGDIVATANGLTSTGFTFTAHGLAVGDWINIGGPTSATAFATAANNTFVRITSLSANAIGLDNLPTGWAADSGTGKTIQLYYGDTLINGTTLWTSTIERVYNDQVTPTFEYFTGAATNTLNLSLTASQIITGSAGMVCQNWQQQTSRTSGATDVPPPTYPVLNATSNFGRIGLAGSTLSGPNFIMSATLAIANGITQDMALGSLGAVGLTNGDFNVTGDLNAYFGDTTVLSVLTSNQATALSFRISDTNAPAETYIIDLPQVKLTSGQVNNVTKNQSVMQAIGYRAVLSPFFGYTAKICRFWYVG